MKANIMDGIKAIEKKWVSATEELITAQYGDVF